MSDGSARADLDNMDVRLGMNIGLAWDAMNSAALVLRYELTGIVDTAIAVAGLPEAQRTAILRHFFAAHDHQLSAEKRLLDAADNIQAAIKDNAPLAQAGERERLDFSSAADAMRIADKLKDAIRTLMNDDDDNGTALYAVLEKYTKPEILALIDSMRQNTPKTGRKDGPTPVTAYILKTAAYLQKLHSLKTNGENYERLIAFLEALPEVQAWQRHGGKDAHEHSIEVQAYANLRGMGRYQGGERLRQMKKDHPQH